MILLCAWVAAQIVVDPKNMDAALAAAHVDLAVHAPVNAQPVALGGVDLLDHLPLDDDERALLAKNGFVIAPGLGGGGPGSVYDHIYTRDVPLFLTADSMLFAWHESSDDAVAEVEGKLAGDLDEALGAMLKAAPRISATGPMKDAVADAVLHLQVARALLASSPASPDGGSDGESGGAAEGKSTEIALRYDADGYAINSVDTLDPRAGGLVDRVNAGGDFASVEIYGSTRDEDFSLYKPRGHYAKTSSIISGPRPLGSYFMAMMWLARMGPLVAGPGSSTRQLAAALVLQDLATSSGALAHWQHIDRFYDALAGNTDFVTLADIGALRGLSGVGNIAHLDEAKLTALQKKLAATTIGKKRIDGTPRVVPFGTPQSTQHIETARRFGLFSQRFFVDAWVLEQVTYNRVPKRTMPDVRDVAYAALGNDVVTADLAEEARINPPYGKNLAAARSVVDALPASFWSDTVDGLWLRALRSLLPTRKRSLPPVFTSDAWSKKVLSTQLASYAELRHDNVLAAEEGFGMDGGCSYPHAYVEPVPDAFRSLASAADLLREAIRRAGGGDDRLRELAKTSARLARIADAELNGKLPHGDDEEFLDKFVWHEHVTMVGCGDAAALGTPSRAIGWYLDLFPEGGDGHYSRTPTEGDPIVSDIFTATNQGVLHAATGGADLIAVVIPVNGKPTIFAGAVSSFFTFVAPPGTRLTDVDWSAELEKAPPRPPWLSSILTSLKRREWPEHDNEKAAADDRKREAAHGKR